MISFSIPYPVSANRYWRSYVPKGRNRAIVVLSEEAKSYKSQVGWIAKTAGMRNPMQGRVHVHIALYPAKPQDAERRMRRLGDGWDDNVRCIDLDNALKITLDAIKGVVFYDDDQVWKLTAERMEPDGEARAVVGVAPILVESR